MPLWRLAARAQAIPRIGVLNSISYGPILDRLDAFLERLEADGFVDGQTVAIAADTHVPERGFRTLSACVDPRPLE